jgi:peptidoglycan/xylan/chitin deacetylase (PgdA/CDA1 family)
MSSIGDACVRTFCSALSPSGKRARLAVFCYHQVLEIRDPWRPSEPTLSEFVEDIETITGMFNVLRLPEALRRLRESSLPRRAACITFDDGYANNAELAGPALQVAGVPATFFVAGAAIDVGIMWNDLVIEALRRSGKRVETVSKSGVITRTGGNPDPSVVGELLSQLKYKPLDQRRSAAERLYREHVRQELPRLMMTREMVRDLFKRGFDIGGHTINHPILKELPDEAARSEITESKIWIESVTGETPTMFAYPNGKTGRDFDHRHVSMVADAGFEAAFSTDWAIASGATDIYNVPRIGPWWRSGRSLLTGLARTYVKSYLGPGSE